LADLITTHHKIGGKKTGILIVLYFYATEQMKARAIILLFPFAIFLAETASFPREVNKTCSKMSCRKMMKSMKCPGKKPDSQRPSGKCNTIPDCSACPVCASFTFQPQYEWFPKYSPFKKNYRLVNTGYISSYVSPVWKPPNPCWFYS
jgi:hypothetical protein